MNENTIFIDDITNQQFKFKKILNKKNTLFWKNCSNLSISIKSKINKLLFINCNDIKLKIGNTISGLEIEKSSNINIKCLKNTNIKYLNLYKSNIKIKLNENQKNNIKFNIDKSNINYY